MKRIIREWIKQLILSSYSFLPLKSWNQCSLKKRNMQMFPSDKHWIRRRRNLGTCDTQTAIIHGISTQARRFHRKKISDSYRSWDKHPWLSHTHSLSIITCFFFLACACSFCHSCFHLPPDLNLAIHCLSIVYVSLKPQRSTPLWKRNPLRHSLPQGAHNIEYNPALLNWWPANPTQHSQSHHISSWGLEETFMVMRWLWG